MATEYLADGLVPQADTQDGLASGIGANHIQQQAGFRGDAGAGRQDDLVKGREVFQREAIVPQNSDRCPQRLHQMGQVIGEAVVIVNDNDMHRAYICSAIKMARRRAFNLLLTSCSSYSSLLRATMPPPAWNHSSLFRLTKVRMVMA